MFPFQAYSFCISLSWLIVSPNQLFAQDRKREAFQFSFPLDKIQINLLYLAPFQYPTSLPVDSVLIQSTWLSRKQPYSYKLYLRTTFNWSMSYQTGTDKITVKQTLKILVAPTALLLFVTEAQMKSSMWSVLQIIPWIPWSRINSSSCLSWFGWTVTYNQVLIDKGSKWKLSSSFLAP